MNGDLYIENDAENENQENWMKGSKYSQEGKVRCDKFLNFHESSFPAGQVGMST